MCTALDPAFRNLWLVSWRGCSHARRATGMARPLSCATHSRGTHLRRSQHAKLTLDDTLTPRSAPTVAFMRVTQATTKVTTIPAAKVDSPHAVHHRRHASRGDRRRLVHPGYPEPVSAEQKKALQGSASPSRSAGFRGRAFRRWRQSARQTRRRRSPLPLRFCWWTRSRATSKLAAQHRADSIYRIAMADTNAVRAPIVRFAQALEKGDTASLRSAIRRCRSHSR
jgi:hypothetical protein